MKSFRGLGLCACLSLTLVGCAGHDATLEEARYLLGKGDVASGARAASMVESLMESSDAAVKFEAIRIYAGGKAAEAGYSSTQIIAALVHKEEDAEFVDLMSTALSGLDTNDDDNDGTINAAELMAQAESALLGAVGSSNAGDLDPDDLGLDDITSEADADFSSLSTEQKNELVFQLGLIRFLEAARVSLNSTGVIGDTEFDRDDCVEGRTGFDVDEANDGTFNLENARRNLRAASLAASNDIVDAIVDFQVEVDPDGDGLAGDDDQEGQAEAAENFCEAIEEQVGS